MTVIGRTTLDCREDVEEFPTKTVAAFQEWFLPNGVSPRDHMHDLLAFTVRHKCLRVSP